MTFPTLSVEVSFQMSKYLNKCVPLPNTQSLIIASRPNALERWTLILSSHRQGDASPPPSTPTPWHPGKSHLPTQSSAERHFLRKLPFWPSRVSPLLAYSLTTMFLSDSTVLSLFVIIHSWNWFMSVSSLLCKAHEHRDHTGFAPLIPSTGRA